MTAEVFKKMVNRLKSIKSPEDIINYLETPDAEIAKRAFDEIINLIKIPDDPSKRNPLAAQYSNNVLASNINPLDFQQGIDRISNLSRGFRRIIQIG
jgi:hypothetical protein